MLINLQHRFFINFLFPILFLVSIASANKKLTPTCPHNTLGYHNKFFLSLFQNSLISNFNQFCVSNFIFLIIIQAMTSRLVHYELYGVFNSLLFLFRVKFEILIGWFVTLKNVHCGMYAVWCFEWFSKVYEAFMS